MNFPAEIWKRIFCFCRVQTDIKVFISLHQTCKYFRDIAHDIGAPIRENFEKLQALSPKYFALVTNYVKTNKSHVVLPKKILHAELYSFSSRIEAEYLKLLDLRFINEVSIQAKKIDLLIQRGSYCKIKINGDCVIEKFKFTDSSNLYKIRCKKLSPSFQQHITIDADVYFDALEEISHCDMSLQKISNFPRLSCMMKVKGYENFMDIQKDIFIFDDGVYKGKFGNILLCTKICKTSYQNVCIIENMKKLEKPWKCAGICIQCGEISLESLEKIAKILVEKIPSSCLVTLKGPTRRKIFSLIKEERSDIKFRVR